MTDGRTRWSAYRRDNIEAAAIILSDVTLYGGEEAGLVRWARMVRGECGDATGDVTAGNCGARSSALATGPDAPFEPLFELR